MADYVTAHQSYIGQSWSCKEDTRTIDSESMECLNDKLQIGGC